MKMDRKKGKKENIFQLCLLILIIIFINIFISSTNLRLDLTQDKRYTLSPLTKEILKTLPDKVIIKVYLEGDLPLAFKKFNQAIKDFFDEIKNYSEKNLFIEFIDPYDRPSNQIKPFFEQLYKQGLQPTNIKIKDKKGGYEEKIVIPGAMVSYSNIDFPVNLLTNNINLSGEENLNNSLQNLEFNFINAIKCVIKEKIDKIAFIEGHGEFDEYQTGSIMRELAYYFEVDRGQINGHSGILNPYKCVIIAGSSKNFSEEDKFVIDQYLMNGGKILWLLDETNINNDSIAQGNAFASINQHNLDDQLFKYGIRINPVLIRDIQCGLIPVSTSTGYSQNQILPAPWYYYPLLIGNSKHPISRNLSLIKSEYASYIDTLNIPELKHYILLHTSNLTNIRKIPSVISLNEIKTPLSKQEFNKAELPVAVLSEGIFTSVFQNRLLSAFKIKGNYSFKERSVPTKMITVADADIIRNDVRYTPNGIKIAPLGFDRLTSQTFANKDFLINAINYLTDEYNLINLRSRTIQLRLLNKELLFNKQTKYKVINFVLPILIIIFLGLVINFFRIKKFSL